MDLKDYYMKTGGSFDEVLGRLRREQTVRKFVYKLETIYLTNSI